MRILWISHLIPYPPKGGVLQRSFNLLKEVSRFHDIDLVAFVQRPFLRYLSADEADALAIARQNLKDFCNEVEFVPLPEDERLGGRNALLFKSLFTVTPYTVNWLTSKRMASAVVAMTGKRRYDAVHLDTVSLVAYRSQISDLPCLLNHHNIESHMMLRRAGNERSPLKKLYMFQEGVKLRRYERKAAGRVDYHVTCSDLDSRRLLETAPFVDDRVTAIPNGVDLDYFSPTFTDKPGNLIFAGRLSAYPNRKAALFITEAIWPKVKMHYPDLGLDIVGADPPPELQRTAARDGRLHVHGFVDDVRPFLRNAAIYLCPITDGGGTKLKILDALAMGKAIIAHPVACEGIRVTPGVDVLYAETVAEYLKQIELLLTDPERRIAMGKAARRLVEHYYGYRAIGEQLATLYTRLAGKAGDSRLRLSPEVDRLT